jgi:hypothetical protein
VRNRITYSTAVIGLALVIETRPITAAITKKSIIIREQYSQKVDYRP